MITESWIHVAVKQGSKTLCLTWINECSNNPPWQWEEFHKKGLRAVVVAREDREYKPSE